MSINNGTLAHYFGIAYIIATCTQGNIRLVNGSNNLEGRVEVCNKGQWGTVCDDGFHSTVANVACRQLGFLSTGTFAM